jgi:hypothetical protein
MFDTSGPGEYTIVFTNLKYNGDMVVTLALHTYDENKEVPVKYDIDVNTGKRFEVAREPGTKEEVTEAVLGGEENLAASDQEVQVVRKTLKEIQTISKQVLNEAKMSFMRQTGHNQDLLENANWNFYVMLLEVLFFVLILAFQTHHLMKTLDNKLIL